MASMNNDSLGPAKSQAILVWGEGKRGLGWFPLLVLKSILKVILSAYLASSYSVILNGSSCEYFIVVCTR